MQNGRIFMTGFSGAGKSTVGRELAQLLKLSFVDLDSEIEARVGKTVENIFESEGEGWFREIEQAVLREICCKFENVVVALGGGTLLNSENLTMVKASGRLLYLRASIEQLKANLEKDVRKRPLLERNSLENLFAVRLEGYVQADLTIDSFEDAAKVAKEAASRISL